MLPGYGDDHPTLEIYSYEVMEEGQLWPTNRTCIAHLAFEVDDVRETLQKVIENGGSTVGELITVDNPNHDNKRAVFVYARDPEGNILELQCWEDM